jgi:ABC-type Na+ transport system ATPase subunit NatA
MLLALITDEIQNGFDIIATCWWNDFEDFLVEYRSEGEMIVADVHDLLFDGHKIEDIISAIETHMIHLKFIANESVGEWSHNLEGDFCFTNLRVDGTLLYAKVQYKDF